MTSLFKNIVVLAVVTVGALNVSTQSANAIDVNPNTPKGPNLANPQNVVRVPEPGAIAPLTLLGAALLLKRRTNVG